MTNHVIQTDANYFIETGTGESGFILQIAINNHFQKIYSIELSYPYYQKWTSIVAPISPRATILHGNSEEIFPKLIHTIPHEMIFSLNAFYRAKPDAKGETYTSLWKELNAIQEHPIKNHTILIPDIEFCGTMRFDFISLDDIFSKIKKINKDYRFFFIDGRDKSQVLVAQID